jgi:hypothetical protein
MKFMVLLALGCLIALDATAAQIRVSANTPNTRIDCQSPGQIDLTGSVLQVRENSFTLDLCLPTQDCSAVLPAQFAVVAPGFSGFQRYLKPSAFVRVHMTTRVLDVCAQQTTVVSVASWVGARNPSGRGDEFYFAAGENDAGLAAGSWFDLNRCAEGNATLGLTAGRTTLTLRTGPAREFVTDENARWTARLLSTRACDSFKGWSYWVAGSPVP